MIDSITRKGFLCFCVLAIGSASALGQRVFVVPEGQTPTLGQTYTIDATPARSLGREPASRREAEGMERGHAV